MSTLRLMKIGPTCLITKFNRLTVLFTSLRLQYRKMLAQPFMGGKRPCSSLQAYALLILVLYTSMLPINLALLVGFFVKSLGLHIWE